MTALVVNEPRCRIEYAGLAVTGEADTELFTSATHGLAIGDAVVFTALTGGTGLTADTVYYVKTVPSGTTFTVSATPGGSTQGFSTDVTAGTFVEALVLDDYLRSALLDQPVEAVDVRTWGIPRASDVGGGIDSITLALLWEPTLHDLMVAREQATGTLRLWPDVESPESYTATVAFDVAPIGRFEIGALVETDLVLSVDDSFTYDPGV